MLGESIEAIKFNVFQTICFIIVVVVIYAGLSRRGINSGPALTPLPSNLEDPSGNWKGTPTGGPEAQNNGAVNNFNAANPNFGGPVFPPTGQSSPAPNNTPVYTASPAPSGSSTPGPQQNVGNAGFPPPNNNAAPPFQGGPNSVGPQMSFGSPSGASTPFGRPGKKQNLASF